MLFRRDTADRDTELRGSGAEDTFKESFACLECPFAIRACDLWNVHTKLRDRVGVGQCAKGRRIKGYTGSLASIKERGHDVHTSHAPRAWQSCTKYRTIDAGYAAILGVAPLGSRGAHNFLRGVHAIRGQLANQ